MATPQQLNSLIRKTKNLVAERNALLTSKEAMMLEIERLKHLLAEQLMETEELNNKIKIIKLAQNIRSDNSENGELTELKRKINEYVKEIDYCIAMLNE